MRSFKKLDNCKECDKLKKYKKKLQRKIYEK